MKYEIVLTVFLLTLLCPAPALARQGGAAAREHFRRGEARMSRNDVDGALSSYDRAIELDPAFAQAYVKRGMARRAKGDLHGSIDDYERAHELNPRVTSNNRYVAESFNNRGFNRLNRLDLGGAISDFTRALEFFPGDADAHYKRGQARLINGSAKEAVADFDKALGIRRDDRLNGAPDPFQTSLLYASRGYALMLQGREEEAQKDFDKCVKLNKRGKLFLDLHILGIETQIDAVKRRRAQSARDAT